MSCLQSLGISLNTNFSISNKGKTIAQHRLQILPGQQKGGGAFHKPRGPSGNG